MMFWCEDLEFMICICVVIIIWLGVLIVKVEEFIMDKIEEEFDSFEEVDYINLEIING